MTQPLNQSLLKAEMETLAKAYVQLQAFAIDSLVGSAAVSDPWHNAYGLCLSAADNIRTAISQLANAYHTLRNLT